MRQIKLRAWHTRDKDWCLSLTFGQENILGVSIGDIFGGDIIFEQFTGLNDKNGKEIYEGDIIQFPEIIPLTVGYEKGSFVWGNLAPFITIREKLEEMPGKVIGNIYENPDLLEP